MGTSLQDEPELIVATNKANRPLVQVRLKSFGDVIDNWSDGSFNIRPHNNECEDTIREICEELGIDCRLD